MYDVLPRPPPPLPLRLVCHLILFMPNFNNSFVGLVVSTFIVRLMRSNAFWLFWVQLALLPYMEANRAIAVILYRG